jgi:hypothetical protein
MKQKDVKDGLKIQREKKNIVATVFRGATPCNLVHKIQHLGGPFGPHIQGRQTTLLPWKLRQLVSPIRL